MSDKPLESAYAQVITGHEQPNAGWFMSREGRVAIINGHATLSDKPIPPQKVIRLFMELLHRGPKHE